MFISDVPCGQLDVAICFDRFVIYISIFERFVIYIYIGTGNILEMLDSVDPATQSGDVPSPSLMQVGWALPPVNGRFREDLRISAYNHVLFFSLVIL